MSNVSDYLKWRGDLDFSQAPFNDVDNLILAQIAYVDFTDIVPAPGSIETITIAEAADTFFDTHDEKEIKKCKSFIGKAPYLLREAAATKRTLPVIRFFHFFGIRESVNWRVFWFCLEILIIAAEFRNSWNWKKRSLCH